MNLLLLLSALLSALTGVTGGRIVEVPQAVQFATAGVSSVTAAAARTTRRPAQTHASLVTATAAPNAATASPETAFARLTNRRRE